MEKEKRYDLIINGIGDSAGGIFNHILINGQGKINGDVDCIDFKVNGLGNVNGNVLSKTGAISGKGEVKGSLKSDEFKVSGTTNIGGNVEATEIRFEGMVCIKGSIAAEKVANWGAVKVYGDCNSESFISKGAFTIEGLLNAGDIEIDLYAPCKAKEIGGEKIKVKEGNSFGLRRLIKSIFPVLDISTGLSVEVIEGDDIHLENTTAKIVRGNDVIIGPGCEIELVEYKNTFKKGEKAFVKESKKL